MLWSRLASLFYLEYMHSFTTWRKNWKASIFCSAIEHIALGIVHFAVFIREWLGVHENPYTWYCYSIISDHLSTWPWGHYIGFLTNIVCMGSLAHANRVSTVATPLVKQSLLMDNDIIIVAKEQFFMPQINGKATIKALWICQRICGYNSWNCIIIIFFLLKVLIKLVDA